MTDTEGRGGRGIEQPARDLGHEFVRIKDYPENVHSKCSLKFTLKGGGVEPTGSSIRRSPPPQRARFGGQTGEGRTLEMYHGQGMARPRNVDKKGEHQPKRGISVLRCERPG